MQADDQTSRMAGPVGGGAGRQPAAAGPGPVASRVAPALAKGLRLLRGFVQDGARPDHDRPRPAAATPRRRRRTRRATASRRSWPGAAWARCGAASTRCWRAGWP